MEHALFDVPTVSLHEHERIDPRTVAHAVFTHPGDIQDILAQHSGVAAIDDSEPPRES